ncbi:hypothetical protein SDRG_14219 [Saprolegnia diclina VS20]|uniref:Uncharacterized protein n=1 Tax=Saprolegnia diclina (strain VS20) TaxID=1156394 RepID=T0Q0B0_SAPDV|nr:hypothetical protein SDRG_14219 [Saprolegnia diclina VS20]EQC27941.1 hypothetical protein SDRG_14219 [Saprolegnia diclina VS20]|eukprot:XP_008618554.1 hypothetical protein SDRG_14219 [Saprolegnia diclina VS20]
MSAEVGPGVASSVFHVNFCSHETLFQDQYTRYQRARKVKVIRCFPHCCPCHVANRYCGMPLQLLTTLAPTSTLRAYASLLKIAPVDHENWALGEMVPPQNGREGDDSDGATWYPGEQEVLDNNVLGSSFNHSLVDGWTYGWKSGRSQSIRDRLHAATGFLFEVVALASGSLAWHLIAKVTSPGFTVATYRNRGGGVLSMAASLPSLSSLPAPIRTMANDLGLLSYFLASVEPSNLAAEVALVGHLVGDMSSPPAPFNCVARLNDTPVSDEHALTAALLAHLLEPKQVAQLRAFVQTHNVCVLAKATLRDAYNDCVLLLHNLANDYLVRAFETTLSLLASLVRQRHPALELAVQARIDVEGRFGYRSVVALFREVSLCAIHHPVAPTSATASALSGEWVFDADASSMDLASGATCSLWDATRWATWLYGCRLDHRGRTLHVASNWQLYASESVFLLDNTPRLLRTFPNGESTMGGTGVVLDGDYVGHVTSAGGIYLECYRYHLLAACSSRLELQLSVHHGTLSCSFKWYCIDGRLDPSLVVAAAAERRALVWASTSAPVVGCGHAAFVRRSVD